MTNFPDLIRSSSPAGETRFSLGHLLVDRYLEFVAGRTRPNTLRAVAFDLKAFFSVVEKDPLEVVAADVFDFLAHQRGDRKVVRITDGESGLSARTIARRLSSVSGFYAYLVARGDTPVRTNPVPKGLSTRRGGGRSRTVPLVRVPKTLPKILSPGEVDDLVGALRTHRDRAMVFAMLLGGLRRCEVLGLRLEDVNVAERSLFVVDGKGGHQRVVPISRSMEMTLTYARITDRVVADEYASVCEQIDRLYKTAGVPGAFPAEIETAAMTRLRKEAHARMLGNGRCTRPAELDCRMESVCETCAYFRTGPEFVPVLLRQRDHARQHGQNERAELFEGLVSRATEESA
jgi:site-specific recombinase XerD